MNVKHDAGIALFLACATVAGGLPASDMNIRLPEQKCIEGFMNTPLQPGGTWHVHDPRRPQPEVAEPRYDGKPVPAPEDAKVLFDGSDMDAWTSPDWLEDGVMVARKGVQQSKEHFGDMHLHVEWLVPEGLIGFGQKQGNSGVFLMGRYEIQVLNCWANRTYPDGMTGALYGQQPPLVNACRPVGEWQSYDIHFKAPVFDGNALVSPASVTVFLNNVLIQDNVPFRGPTRWRSLSTYKAHQPTGAIRLQYHKNPVRFRNIWVAPLKVRLGKLNSGDLLKVFHVATNWNEKGWDV
ncbi:MAG: DUF1080 domain-containing protein [Verrucomicrobia bacterium]|jgi:hypothetical protein|nr:DUF1080 domain-containing protein [Verrucomicrobiota bacterium]